MYTKGAEGGCHNSQKVGSELFLSSIETVCRHSRRSLQGHVVPLQGCAPARSVRVQLDSIRTIEESISSAHLDSSMIGEFKLVPKTRLHSCANYNRRHQTTKLRVHRGAERPIVHQRLLPISNFRVWTCWPPNWRFDNLSVDTRDSG